MKRSTGLLIALILVFAHSDLKAQFVADGWRVASEIKADSKLIGTWEVIAGYDLDNDSNREFFFVTDPSSSIGAELFDTDPWTVFYYESTGDDAYEEQWSWAPPIQNNGLRGFPAIAVGDVDQDNLSELWYGLPLETSDDPPNPNRLFVFEHDGTNLPTTPSESWNLGLDDNFRFIVSGIRFGDLDSDNDVEMVIQSRNDDFTGAGAGRTMLVANTGGIDIGLGLGAFTTEFTEIDKLKGGGVYDPRIVDFDRDGVLEVWIFTWDFFTLAIYEATAPNTYELQVELDEVFPGLDYGQRMMARFYDVDGDDKLEMYTATLSGDGSPGSVILYMASTDDVSSLTAQDLIVLGGRNADPGHGGAAVGDIDGDGLMDYLYIASNPATQKRSQVFRMEYKGAGDLADSTSYDWSLLFENTNAESDLRSVAIDDLDGDNKTDILITNLDVASTDEAVLYILESETPTSVKKTSNLIRDFALHQNYPNPFNPTTTIVFDIQSAEQVVLTVFDLDGRRVAVLVDEQLAPGVYKATFNANQFPSGIYFYELTAGKTKTTRKMVLAK
jgi:hypothetical protein